MQLMRSIMQTVLPITIGDIEIGFTLEQPFQHVQMTQISGQMNRILRRAVMGSVDEIVKVALFKLDSVWRFDCFEQAFLSLYYYCSIIHSEFASTCKSNKTMASEAQIAVLIKWSVNAVDGGSYTCTNF